MRISSWDLAQGDESDDAARRLRVHVSRLHADLVAIETVLGLCENRRLDVAFRPVESHILRLLDLLLRPSRHGFASISLLARVLGHARDVYDDIIGTTTSIAGSIDNPKIVERVDRLSEMIKDASQPSSRGILVRIEELIMARNENTISGGNFHGPVNQGEGGAHMQVGGVAPAQLRELIEQMTAAAGELAKDLPDEQAVAVEDAAAGVSRELEQEASERNERGVRARLKTLFEIASEAGTAGASLAGAVSAIQAILGM
ncbi:hypothetical protein [Nonomuraea sp. B19D2]|uniref:hypothetical protein n=1 Tax=Nonomuraea sp. B19D2 TaxID=3159561 RepID=UPI0032D9CDFE